MIYTLIIKTQSKVNGLYPKVWTAYRTRIAKLFKENKKDENSIFYKMRYAALSKNGICYHVVLSLNEKTLIEIEKEIKNMIKEIQLKYSENLTYKVYMKQIMDL